MTRALRALMPMHIDGGQFANAIWHHVCACLMNPKEMLAKRREKMAMLARYGRRVDLAQDDADIAEIEEAMVTLSGVLKDERIDTQAAEME